MDFISLLANITQIISLIWTLLFGGKAISEILRGRVRSRPYTIRPSLLLNIVLAFLVFLLSSALWFKLNPTSGNTHVAPGTILYRADWSKGLDGWTQVPGEFGDTWQIMNGQLMNKEDSVTNNGIFLAPVHFGNVTDYLVEIKMKISSTVASAPLTHGNPKLSKVPFKPLGGCPSFYIITRWTQVDHFRLDGSCFLHSSSGSGFDVIGAKGAVFETIGSDWVIYSFQAKQDHYKFTIGNLILDQYTDKDAPNLPADSTQAGQTGISVLGMQVSISSFTVTAL